MFNLIEDLVKELREALDYSDDRFTPEALLDSVTAKVTDIYRKRLASIAAKYKIAATGLKNTLEDVDLNREASRNLELTRAAWERVKPLLDGNEVDLDRILANADYADCLALWFFFPSYMEQYRGPEDVRANYRGNDYQQTLRRKIVDRLSKLDNIPGDFGSKVKKLAKAQQQYEDAVMLLGAAHQITTQNTHVVVGNALVANGRRDAYEAAFKFATDPAYYGGIAKQALVGATHTMTQELPPAEKQMFFDNVNPLVRYINTGEI